MNPQPPERISFILLKSFAPGSLLCIPWGSYVRFHEDIIWCLCCCNRLRLWEGAGQLVYIPVFSLVQVHHERIAHMWHLFPFGRGEVRLWTSRIEGWIMSSSLFRRRWAASAGLFVLSVPLIVRWYMLQISGGKSAGRLRRLLRPGRPI